MNDEFLESISEIAQQLAQLRNTAYMQYSLVVQQVLDDQITDVHSIERIMDSLLDFCDEDRFIEIYRRLCRHIYYKFLQLVGEHVALFRAQFEINDP